MNRDGLRAITAVLVLLLLAPCKNAESSQDAASATIRGIVLDRADGAPIADASVWLQDAQETVKTDASGRFELTGVAPGRRTVNVSIVGFILVKRVVTIGAGETVDLTIPLTEGTGTYSEQITVTSQRFPEQEPSVPSQQTLGSADIQNLRSLLTNDPMRAVQILPGVTTGDDFRAEFAVRGSGFDHLNFTFDGVPTTFLVHTIQQVDDGGSVAMMNGDILDGITLLNGAYPQRYGNRLGAELDFHMREGSRDRWQTRVGVSGTDASAVVEGPVGRRKNGSWLVSVRQSYLDLLLDRIRDDSVGFGFTDAQAKVVYDVSPAHRLELSVIAGRSRLDQPDADSANEVQDGRNAAQFATLAWRMAPASSFVLTQRLAFAANQFTNVNIDDRELGSGGGRDFTWRGDFVDTRGKVTFEGGGQVQRQQREAVERAFNQTSSASALTESYDAHAWLASAYALGRWNPSSRFSIAPGLRVDRWSLTGDAGVSPWVQGEIRIADSIKMRAGAGVHRQFPAFAEVSGLRGGGDLQPERAYHADLGLEQTIGADTRWQVTFYDRRERDLLRLPDSEPRLDGTRVVLPDLDSRWVNSLDGYARGIEFLLQRRRGEKLAGWFLYTLGFNRYKDRFTGEGFDGDFDQRHAINAYGLYRHSDRMSLAARLRIGSNVPATGYWQQQGAQCFVAATRNDLRVPAYSRLDVRANRTFNRRSMRLTLFVEVLNVLGRDNVRYASPGVNIRTGQAFGIFDEMFPLIPSAGVLLEF